MFDRNSINVKKAIISKPTLRLLEKPVIHSEAGQVLVESATFSEHITNEFISSSAPNSLSSAKRPKYLTIEDVGWTREDAIRARGMFAAFAEDWDDPAMDIYDEFYSDKP